MDYEWIMKALLTALIKAKMGFLPIKKDKINPHFRSRYADLDSILSAVEPALLANGLIISQTIETLEMEMVLITTLWHAESGESIVSRYALPAISDSQKFGSALTYARRYAVSALLSLTADDDDDSNSNKSLDAEREQLMAESKKLFLSMNLTGKQAQSFINQHFGVPTRENLNNQQIRELINLVREVGNHEFAAS